MGDHPAFTSELKFALDEGAAAAVREWARLRLSSDPHSTGGGDSYSTTTLYFDTPGFDLFFRRRSYARAKFRIRRYNDGPMVFLERKLRIGDHLSKRRSEAAAGDLALLAGRNDWSGAWFARRLERRNLHPVCQVAYHRAAYVGMSTSGPLRLTIDRRLTAAPIHVAAFTNTAGAAILPGRIILELKYGAHMPALFERLIEEFRLSPLPISKYRVAVRALGLAADGETICDWIDGSPAVKENVL